MTEKKIGKIQGIKFGYGGYDDAMLGIGVTLGSDKECWGTGDFKGTWAFPPNEDAKWTLADQTKTWGDMVRWFGKLLAEAKVHSIEDLKGIPVEVTFQNDRLSDWRILTEAI